MIAKVSRVTYSVLLVLLTGCASLAPLLSPPTPAPVSQATSTPQPLPSASPTLQPTSAARVLRVWLPPRFDPNADTPSAKLLKQRFADFETAHRGLKIDVRIKVEEGETGLLNSLLVTSNAAPSALPDLIALSRPDLEAAALKGLLHPIDGLSTMLHDPNWYEYARELGRIQNIGYGLPFAGNALVFMHRPQIQVNTWDEIFSSKENLLFPVSDQDGLVPLAIYVSVGGKLVNEQGLPILEEAALTQTLTLIQKGFDAKTFPLFMLDFKTDEASFQSYHDGYANMVLTWYLHELRAREDIIQPIPSVGNAPHTFTTGWIWALAGSAPENQQVATELAEYMIADEFVNQWLPGTGYLPTRLLPANDQDVGLKMVLESAQALPSNDVLAALGPTLNQALSRVLNGEQIQTVVRSVLEEFK